MVQTWDLQTNEVKRLSDLFPGVRDPWRFRPVSQELVIGFTDRSRRLVKLNLKEQKEEARVPAGAPDCKCKRCTEESDVVMWSASRRLLVHGTWIRCGSGAGREGPVLVRRAEDLRVEAVTQIPAGLVPSAIAMSADEKCVVVGAFTDDRREDGVVLVYDVATGKLLRRLGVDGRYGVAVSPDGGMLAAARKVLDKRGEEMRVEVELVDFRTGEELAVAKFPWVKVPRMEPWVAGLHWLAFSPDGKELIASRYHDTRIWRIQRVAATER